MRRGSVHSCVRWLFPPSLTPHIPVSQPHVVQAARCARWSTSLAVPGSRQPCPTSLLSLPSTLSPPYHRCLSSASSPPPTATHPATRALSRPSPAVSFPPFPPPPHPFSNTLPTPRTPPSPSSPPSSTTSLLRSIFVLPLPLPPSTLSFWSRLGRVLLELLFLGSSIYLSVQLVPPLARFVYPALPDVYLNFPILATAVVLYSCFALLLHRFRPLPSPLLSSPSPSPRLSLLPGVVLSFLLSLTITLLTPLLGRSSREEPLILQLCFSALLHLSTLLQLCLTGPIAEELFFRGLLFARLCPLLPLPLAYALSSALFGAVHYSPEASKTVEAMLGGVVAAAAYRWTMRLAAPVLVHVMWNATVALSCVGMSPLLSEEALERGCRMYFGMGTAWEDAMWEVQRRLPRMQPTHAWGPPENAPQKRAKRDREVTTVEPMTLVRQLFRVLDRGEKGYLSAEEAAFFFTLDPMLLDVFAAAFLVLQTDIPPMPPATAAPYAVLLSSSTSPSSALSLPSRHFLSSPSPQQVHAISALYEAFTSPPLSDADASVLRPTQLLTQLTHSVAVTPSSLAYGLMLRYYGVVMRVFGERCLGMKGGRMEREGFERVCGRMAVLEPTKLKELMRTATTIAMGAQLHPLAALEVRE